MNVAELKQRAAQRVADLAGDLIDISRQIHANPELNFEEHDAHALLTEALNDLGGPNIAVTRSAYGVDTAFDAVSGTVDGPTIAVLCEYDALPGIGHACGHNIIAAAGLGAGLAAAAVAGEAGGRIRIIGTPAEEGGGGKIVIARQGAFQGVDAAMMIHPADADLIRMDTIALQQMSLRYQGRAAHAAAAPWEGRNALDAAVLGYMNVAALRQHIRPTERVHGVIRRGGDKANIVPAETEMEWIVRSPTIASLEPLKQRVTACLEAAATACGCTSHLDWDPVTYADMLDNGPMVASYVANAADVGRTVADPAVIGKPVVGSTDMGNVSYLVPSIHPMIKVADEGVAIHTVDFADFAGGEAGDRAVIDGAVAMAMTVIDLWTDTALLSATKDAFLATNRNVDVLG